MSANPDVVVVGGGPAGSTVAGLLAREGVDTLLVDRATFPRPKPCGECVNPGAVAALERLGLLRAVLALDPAPLNGWRVGGVVAQASGAFGRGVQGLGVPRADLDHALLREAMARGARVREGVRVEDAAPARDGHGPTLTLRQGSHVEEVRPRLIVGADGLRSRVARALGRVDRKPRTRKVSITCRLLWPEATGGRGLLSVRDGVTLGVAPVHRSAGLWNATLVLDTDHADAAHGRLVRAPLDLMADLLTERMPFPGTFQVVGGPWASGPFDHPVSRPWAPGVVLVGDAAGYYDPFTGQGIYRALRSGELAAAAALETLAALDDRADGRTGRPARPWAALERYGRTWARETRGPRALQRIVEAVMSRPAIRERVLPRLDAGGGLSGIIRVTGDAAPVSLLLKPAWWIPALAGSSAARAPADQDLSAC